MVKISIVEIKLSLLLHLNSIDTNSEIRKLEPTRTVIMGLNRRQTTENFKYRSIPKGDINIILSFHYYSPYAFTHYKTNWTEFNELGIGTNYPGWAIDKTHGTIDDEKKRTTIEKWTKYSLEKEIMLAVDISQKYGLKLFYGEFGCFPSTSDEQRLRWYNDIIEIFNKQNIAWSHWNYKNDFPLVDPSTLKPNKDFISILMK